MSKISYFFKINCLQRAKMTKIDANQCIFV